MRRHVPQRDLVLIALALAVMPRSVQGRQVLLVTDQSTFVSNDNTVSEYNATTGAAINANFITGLSAPMGLAVDGNNHLFVANFITNQVGEYVASTGSLINASFISANLQGLNGITGLVLDGNNHLFLGNTNNGVNGPPGTIAEYNATTGAVIKADFATLSPGYPSPYGIALDGNNHLFANNRTNNKVEAFDATTGAPINSAFVNGQPRDSPSRGAKHSPIRM